MKISDYKIPKAFIKRDFDLDKLKDYGFVDGENMIDGRKCYMREIKSPVYLVIDKRTRELNVRTPLGKALVIEAHKDKYQDLLDAGLVEYRGIVR